MSLECPRSPIHKTSVQQKLQSKNAAKIYRYGSPKLRDLLRQKCRIRMHEARQNNFEKSRDLNGSFARRLEILREEVADLELDINLQEAIYKELMDEVNDWFVGQQENEEDYIINVVESNVLVCPMCQKLVLNCEASLPIMSYKFEYKCECGISFQTGANCDKLREILSLKVDAHEQNCSQPLTFFVEPATAGPAAAAMDVGDQTLNAVCYTCDFVCSF